MKKILLLFLTFTLVISVFSGCGKNSSKSKKVESNKINYSDTYVFGQDMQNNLFHQEYNNICESKDSYYYLENGFVYIIDKKVINVNLYATKPIAFMIKKHLMIK